MENHPIPQNVTGFQFNLIGSMTIKQFAYLVTGVLLAWVFLQMPIYFLIKLPISAFFAILGASLAFVPIGGRPMDVMAGNYIKALFRPTQFVYKKTGANSYFLTAPVNPARPSENHFNLQPNDQLKTYLKNQTMEKQDVALNTSPAPETVTQNASQVNSFNPPSPAPTVSIPPTQPAHVLPTPQIAPMPLIQPKQSLKFVKNTGMPSAPESPNLITGIVKDPRGNPLSNILVEIKDKEGNPVRAFKTNEVGRFASATQLINGIYAIEFEDPKGQNRFEAKPINANGQIISPVEAISIDSREELRRSLFSPDAPALNN